MKLIVNGKEEYIDDSKVPDNERGYRILEDLEDTKELEKVDESKLLEDTLVDLWGDNNG